MRARRTGIEAAMMAAAGSAVPKIFRFTVVAVSLMRSAMVSYVAGLQRSKIHGEDPW